MDESYAVHHDVESQTKGVIYMGLGVTNYRPSKKKLNTNRSMEAELAITSKHVPYNIW